MSDGGKESGRKQEGSDGYGRALAKIGVAQICESVGFQSFQQSALDVLSEVAVRYVRELGKTASLYANLAGRTECSVFDVVQGLEDLVSMQGFAGASDVNRSLAGSGTVKEVMQYVSSEEIPFAREVVRFPVAKDRKPTPSFLQAGEATGGEHIPGWLPAFPDPKTYTQTPELEEKRIDPPGEGEGEGEKVEEVKQRKKEEESLHSLQQRLAGNGSSGFTSLTVVEDGKAKQTAESNPFLAPPLPAGEKDVSSIVPPEKVSNQHLMDNHNSVIEAFAPAIGPSNVAVSDSREDDDRKVLPSKRAVVNFKLGVSKKSLGPPLDLTLLRSVGESSPLFVRDYEKDDKKRRAEQILKDSMDNSRELS